MAPLSRVARLARAPPRVASRPSASEPRASFAFAPRSRGLGIHRPRRVASRANIEERATGQKVAMAFAVRRSRARLARAMTPGDASTSMARITGAVVRAVATGASATARDATTTLGSGIDFFALAEAGERPSAAYGRLVSEGFIRHDDAQIKALEALDAVHASVKPESSRAAQRVKTGGWFGGLFDVADGTASGAPVARDGGAYIHGGPGSGKTFVMDLFYATLAGERGVEKRREHFHSFMLETHTALHKLKDTARNSDTVGVYATALAQRTRVLCLDEFQIVDVADAMIIRRLLEALWAAGVKVVTTSNRHPDELYKNGLNRSQFLPCIAQIKERCIVHEMASDRDYRLTGSVREGDESVTWMSRGSQGEREAWLSHRLQELAHERSFKPLQIAVGGRLVHVRRAGGGIAHFDFHELCDSALGAADYTALASIFSAIGVGHVPRLSSDRLDLVRRFITFIDVMYEHKVKLLVSAETEPAELFQSSSGDDSARKNAARDEEFAWDRTVSRLMEMQTKEFQEAAWRPKAGAWLLEQARVKVDEVLPVGVLRSLWQRYDTSRDNILDESELECLIGDLNQMRLGHRHVSDDQLDAFMSSVCQNSLDRKNARSNRYVTYEEFEKFGNEAFVACMRHR